MSSPSPICLVNGAPIPIASNGVTGVNVAGGTSVSIKLASNAGVTSWNCFCSSTDGYNPNSTTALINATIVNNFTGYSLTFTTPVTDGYYGSSMQWTSIVNANTNSASQITFGIFVPNLNGTRLFFNGETTESSIYGVSYDLNAAIVIAAGSNYVTGPITTNYNVQPIDTFISVGTLSTIITITLMASPISDDTVVIKDTNGSAAQYPIFISGNGKLIDGLSSITISNNYGYYRLTYTGTQWSVN